MRSFKFFFMLSLGFFLLMFFAKFLVFAFLTAIVLTFIGFVVRSIRLSRAYYLDRYEDPWMDRHPIHQKRLSDPWVEPLDDRVTGREWEEDFRSITVY